MNAPRITAFVLAPLVALPAAAQCAWQDQGLLTPPGGYGSEPQYFARSLALQQDELLVGSPGLDGAPGSAQLFLHVPEGWVPAEPLVAEVLDPSDDFGRAVALAGDVAAVGAPLADGGAGRVHVFERTAGGWSEVAALGLPAGSGNLGAALALHGTTLLAGAPAAGRVLVFERGASGWTQTAALEPDEDAESFGAAVALDGVRAVVGAPLDESAYVFEREDAVWVETQELEAEDELVEAAFGASVALSGDAIAIGAEGEQDDDDPPGPGAVYVFRHAGTWEQEATVPAPSGDAGMRFGASVALAGDVLAVGSPGDQGGLGRVFAFHRVAGHWFEAAALAPYLDATQGQFGTSVALGPDALLANVGLDETGLIGAVGPYAGAAQAWGAPSLECDMLLTDRHSISTGQGGTQALLLGLGAPDPGPLYLVLGSMSGAAPGSVLGPIGVPLNEDAYLAWTAAHPNTGPLEASFGAFPQGAPALAGIALEAGAAPELIGLELHHAFVGIDLASPQLLTYASNAVALTLLP